MGSADKSGKSDMERVGLFQEMTYVTLGDRYVSKPLNFNEAASVGKQLLPGGSKMNSALQHGYFEPKFNRVFEGEAYSEPVSIRRRYRMEQRKKDIGKPFLPANGPKTTCGLGNYYGTIGGPVEHFSPVARAMTPTRAPGRNFFTNPGKHGTGYGAKEQMHKDATSHKKLLKGGPMKAISHPGELFWPNPYKFDSTLPVTKPLKMTKFANVSNSPFKPSSPGKKSGGCKLGTFDPYPAHSEDVYNDKRAWPKDIVNNSGRTYMPHPGPKTRPVNSIISKNVIRSMNIKNYRTMTEIPAC
ncbi:cilia-and flagella-associated protein 96-like [Babylonia areolata]|uniref:cilia-and flagella-associated protein 96-like n=1 Tax=Babylonia areolata TaxID=304850 RepID=UPI003FD29D87